MSKIADPSLTLSVPHIPVRLIYLVDPTRMYGVETSRGGAHPIIFIRLGSLVM